MWCIALHDAEGKLLTQMSPIILLFFHISCITSAFYGKEMLDCPYCFCANHKILSTIALLGLLLLGYVQPSDGLFSEWG